MLKLLDWEFKTTKGSSGKRVDSMQEQMGNCRQRDDSKIPNSKKESKIDARNKKHCDRNEECP